MALLYCKKCGRIVDAHDKNGRDVQSSECACCGSSTYPVPEKYWLDGLNFLITNEQKELLREELVKTSPEFDQYLFDNRERILREKSSGVDISFYKENGEIKARVVGSLANTSTLKCPYCGSTNISKIGTLNRAVSVGLLGLASSKIGKTHKCNKCGSTW